MTQYKEQILKLVDKDYLNITNIAERLGVERLRAKGMLEILAEQGLLKAVKVGKSIVYMPQPQ